MNSNGIARVHYFDRQFLRTQDFADEQAYHVAMRRRHNIAHHSWGIVQGLAVVTDEEKANLFVQPGMAIDGYGRELILPQKRPLSTASFDNKESDVLDVWLVYERINTDQAPQGYAGCQPNGQGPFYRWREEPLVRLDKPNPAFPNRRRPQSVPDGDLAFGPSRIPPDTPEDDWPVFLGQVKREGTAPDEPYIYSVDPSDRPYVGLLGETITAPSGRARVELSDESADEPERFAVFIPDPHAHPEAYLGGKRQPRLEIRKTGEIDVSGDVTLHGDLKLSRGAVEFGVGQARSPHTPPWRMYHHLHRISIPSSQTGEPPQELLEHQLRIEMAGGSGGRNQVVIGFWSAEDNEFKPCLTITDECRTIVHGDLIVKGKIRETTVRPTAQLTPEARGFGQAALLTGIGGASTLLETFYRSPFDDDLQIVARLLDSAEGRQNVVGVLLETAERREGVLTLVIREETGRQALVTSLVNSPNQLGNFAARISGNQTTRQAVIVSLLEIEDGRQGIIDNLVNHSQLADFTERLVDNPATRSQTTASLLAIADGREALVGNLAGHPELEDFTERLLAEPSIRTQVTESLLAIPDGRAVIITVLTTHPDQLADFAARISGNQTTRQAVIVSLLAIDDGRAEVVDGLLASAEGQQEIIDNLLEVEEGRQRVVDTLEDHPELADFTERLVDNASTRDQTIVSLLEIEEGRQGIVASLEDHPLLADFTGRLVDNSSTRSQTVASLIESTEGRASVADAMLDAGEGLGALASSLQADETRIENFASLLLEEFSDLADQLREALTPTE